MKLLFKRRVFSWFGSFEIYDDAGSLIYTVKGKPSWGHRLLIYDAMQENVGEIKQKMALLPQFHMILHGEEVGVIKKEPSFLHPTFEIGDLHWTITGNFFELTFDVMCQDKHIMHVAKEALHVGDTYALTIDHDQDALLCLLVVLAIEASKHK